MEGASANGASREARAALALSHRGYVLDLGQNRLEGRGRDELVASGRALFFTRAPSEKKELGA